jgi:hypothetical protein
VGWRLAGGEGREEGGGGGGAGESLHWVKREGAGREEMATATGARARGGEESESGGGGRRLEMDGRTGTRDFRGEVRGERVTWRIVRRRIVNGRGSEPQRGSSNFFALRR